MSERPLARSLPHPGDPSSAPRARKPSNVPPPPPPQPNSLLFQTNLVPFPDTPLRNPSPAKPCRRATIYLMRHAILITAALLAAFVAIAAPPPIQVTEGSVTIPTYVHTARETQPPLFSSSTIGGLYPFTTYVMPYQPGGPKPKAFRAVFLENEYL